MQIGFVTIEPIGKPEENKTWTKMTIRIPMMRPADFKLSAHKKTKDSEPDFDIYYLHNGRGENFRQTKVGALWKKIGKKSLEEFYSGNIEHPLVAGGILYIAVTRAKQLYEGEKVHWTHDVLWSAERKEQDKDDSYGAGYSSGSVTDAEEDIPF